MALQFIDSFDHYGTGATGTANMLAGPYAQADQSNPSATQKRTGINSLEIELGTAIKYRRVLSSAQTVVSVGFGIFLTALPTNNNSYYPITFRDAANSVQVSLIINSTGTVSVYRGTGTGTLLGTSSIALTASAWHHLEIKVVFSQTVGTVTVNINSISALALTGLDTVNTALVECSQIAATIAGAGNAHVYYIDDLYCTDGSGSSNTGLLGDCKVYTLYPNADGALEEWTLSTGTDSFALIDEAIPDGDTTYIEAAAVNDDTEVGFENLPADVVNVYGVQVVSSMKKTDAGACSVQQSINSDGTVGTGTTHSITTAYTYWQSMFEVDPDTSAQWTKAGVDAAQVRVTRTV